MVFYIDGKAEPFGKAGEFWERFEESEGASYADIWGRVLQARVVQNRSH